MAGPLQGLRVLDLSRILAGPWATQLLADLGAEVIKVERPGSGDDTRHWGPPFLRDTANRETSESAYFLSTNRGKRSVTIDLSCAAGAELIKQLAAQSDVLIENFRTGTLHGYGLGWEDLSAVNSRLIYCSISAFGQGGPQAAEPGYDALIQAMGGLMSITGIADGEPGAGPVKVGVAIADLMAGMYAVSAILAALHHRGEGGQGQYIDLSLLDTQIAWLANQNMNYLLSGVAPGRLGSAHPNIVPYQAIATADGPVMLAVGNDGQFARLAELLGRPQWATDARYATNRARVQHRRALIASIEAAFAAAGAAEWLARLRAAGIPCAPINDLAAVFAEPQVRHRGLQITLPHSLGRAVPAVANPIRYTATPVEPGRAAPLLGEDTAAVLTERLGLSAEQLARLRADGVV